MTRSRTFYIQKGEIRDDNDCTRRALEYATGITPLQAKRATLNNGWTPQGMTITNTILSLWDVARRKPEIQGMENVSIEEAVRDRTGLLFYSGHVIGIKDGVPEEPLPSTATCAAWID
jgi:hypothetical protein